MVDSSTNRMRRALVGKSGRVVSTFRNSPFLILLSLLILLWGFFSLASPNFLSVNNLLTIARSASTIGIAAAGVTIALVSGSLDLSTASTISMAGVVLAAALKAGAHPALAILICLASGAFVGLTNGLIVTKLRLDPFIVTLGMSSIVRGLTFAATGAANVYITNPLFDTLGRGRLWGVLPVPVLPLVIVFVLLILLMRFTLAGRLAYAIGGNQRACLLSGVKVDHWRTLFLVISGTLSALGGLFLASLLGLGMAKSADGFELSIVSAVVLGGTALSGGKGTIQGTLVGVILLSSLTNGLIILNVNSFYQMMIRGGVLILAVALDRLRE